MECTTICKVVKHGTAVQKLTIPKEFDRRAMDYEQQHIVFQGKPYFYMKWSADGHREEHMECLDPQHTTYKCVSTAPNACVVQ